MPRERAPNRPQNRSPAARCRGLAMRGQIQLVKQCETALELDAHTESDNQVSDLHAFCLEEPYRA